MTDVKKALPGTPLLQTPIGRSAFQNDLVDVVNAFKQGLLGARPGTLRAQTSSNQVEVRNDTGGDLPRGSVVQLGAYLLDELTPGRWMFEGDLVGAALTSKIVITKRATPSGKIDKALMGGICIARVDVQDEDDTHAGPVEGETYLESSGGGPFEILSAPDGTGEQELIVRFDAAVPAITAEGVLDADLEAGGDSTMTVSDWGPTGNEPDPTDSDTLDVSAWNIPAGYKLPSGAGVVAIQIGGVWRVITSDECPVEVT